MTGLLARLSVARDKALWGVRTVGPVRSACGFAALASLRLRRPARSTVSLRSGYALGFRYPSQVPTMLVAFGDLVDPEYAFLREVAAPGWRVVDAGAAIGQFTIFAARVPGACVHAFEPSGSNVATLEANLELNAVAASVSVHRIALGDHRGTGVFETAGHTWVSGLDTTGGSSGDPVPVRTLADQLDELGLDHVDVLKVNVAGYEPEVLEGALPSLRAGRVDVLVLLLGLRSLPYYAELAEIGYRLFFFEPRTRRLHEITAVDESLLDCRPSPARHLIAVRSGAMQAGLAGHLDVVAATPRQVPRRLGDAATGRPRRSARP